jgi:hypothetical protein
MGRATRRRARQRVLWILMGVVAAVLIASVLVVAFDRWLR